MSTKATGSSLASSSKRARYNNNNPSITTTVTATMNGNNNEHTPVDGEILSYNVPSSMTVPCITGLMYGSSPSGTMQILLSNSSFPGLPPPGASHNVNSASYKPTIQILYDIPDGIQSMHYHKNPGVRYTGTSRTAFLPNTDAGCRLLSRMKVAFLHGHIFSVGRSITNGCDNQTTWSLLVPSKTSLHGGPFGFPDPNYIPVANLSLDTIGIPDADNCAQFLQGLNNNSNNSNASVSSTAAVAPVAVAQIQSAPVLPTGVQIPALSSKRRARGDETIHYKAPKTLASSDAMKDVFQTLTTTELMEAQTSEQECPLCLERIICDGDCKGTKGLAKKSAAAVCKIGKCGHIFHRECINEAVEHHPKCPICRVPLSEPQGKSPSGSMQIRLDVSQPCPGFTDSQGTYIISYSIPSGTQASYHENPGHRFSGAQRTAYIPNNEDGRKLLCRLKYAFAHGLTFRVGTSLTSGMHNQVTWTSIHHKTGLNFSSYLDPHSFPDDNYILNVNESLDALHVPPHDECQ